MERNTHQRSVILSYLEQNKVHPTAQELFDAVKKKIPHISRGTVYRNLDVLCDQKKVRAVPLAGTNRFESIEHEGEHDHFVCDNCQEIIDIHLEDIDKKVLLAFAKKHPELSAESVTISWSGSCPSCKKKNR